MTFRRGGSLHDEQRGLSFMDADGEIVGGLIQSPEGQVTRRVLVIGVDEKEIRHGIAVVVDVEGEDSLPARQKRRERCTSLSRRRPEGRSQRWGLLPCQEANRVSDSRLFAS